MDWMLVESLVVAYPPPPPPPTPAAADPIRALEHHEAALSGLRAGLVDLEASPSYLMLVNESPGGETERKVGGAGRDAADLWPLVNAAGAALDEVRTYLSVNGQRGQHRGELIRLLSEQWVPVEMGSPPRTAAAGAPSATVTGMRYSIGEILDLIRFRYDAIREWATQITDLWLTIIPRADAAKATLARLEAEVAQLGVLEPLIGRARALVNDLEERLVTDPLSVVPGDGDQLDAQVAAAAAQVATLRTGHDALEGDLAATEGLLASLRLLRSRAEAAAAEARSKVVDPGGLVRVPSPSVLDGASGLAARLDGLYTKTESGSWTQRRTLLDSWLSMARKLETQLERAERANREPLRRRDELRGRLRAYRAKIAAVGRAEDLELTAVADEARAVLFTAPADLERASATMDELARRLRS
jgi:hypothetical protein